MTRPAPGTGSSCLVCGTEDASVLNLVSGKVNGRRVFDTVCDKDMSAGSWTEAFFAKHSQDAAPKSTDVSLTEKERTELNALLATVLSNSDQWELFDLAALRRVHRKINR